LNNVFCGPSGQIASGEPLESLSFLLTFYRENFLKGKRRLSTVDLLVKIARFVKKITFTSSLKAADLN
jgi:hypothetical protein